MTIKVKKKSNFTDCYQNNVSYYVPKSSSTKFVNSPISVGMVPENLFSSAVKNNNSNNNIGE